MGRSASLAEEPVSTFVRSVLAGAAILMAVIGLARAQRSPAYVVTYVDVMPNETNSGAVLLQHYRDVSQKEDSNLRTTVLQEIGRPNRFAIIEIWKDKAASEAHDKASSTTELFEKVKAISNAPFDRRLDNGLYVDSRNSEKQRDAIYVLTHIDVSTEQGRLHGAAQVYEHRHSEGFRQHRLQRSAAG